MDFNFETREMAVKRLIEDLGYVYGSPNIEIKPYNDYSLDLRYSIRFYFETSKEKELEMYKALKRQDELGISVIGHSSLQGEIHFSIYFAPTPTNRFDVVIFDSKTKEIDCVISRENHDLALISFFEHYGFKTFVEDGRIHTIRGRSRISTKSWKDMFNKRQYDLIADEKRSEYINKVALFNYQNTSGITSLDEYAVAVY